MRTMHPTLLIGSADWDPAHMPREEFEQRLKIMWAANESAVGAVVFGNSFDHAALAYLTNFTPKLEAALAFIPYDGEPELLVGGGVNMIAAARPLTWIEHLKPLRDVGKAVADWARMLPSGGRIILIGGDAMPLDKRRALDATLTGNSAIDDGTERLRAQMLRKAPNELVAVRKACVGLDRAVAALRAEHKSGAGVTDLLLAAEHAGQLGGAQDVRSLFSVDHGCSLRPFEVPIDVYADIHQVYIAVRHANYWAEGFMRSSQRPDSLGARADSVLQAMIAAAKPGLSCHELAQAEAEARGPWRAHPMTDGKFGNAIGLVLEEPVILARASTATLTAGAIYSLRAGVLDGDGAGAITSAMLLVTASGNEVLWSTSIAR
jgi:Xaa-Pro aminopeptidase